ncbi:hypothetical protein FQA39_LY18221 [Lamprigera yunnana]|nr:hypothetical protein FQA39_LY18221 [Lamprigera yunnana]
MIIYRLTESRCLLISTIFLLWKRTYYAYQNCYEQFHQEYLDNRLHEPLKKGQSAGRPTVLSEDVQERMDTSPHKSLRHLSAQTGLSLGTCQKASSSADNEILLDKEFSKLQLKGAVIYMNKLLEDNNLVTLESPMTISYESTLIGEEMYNNTVQMISEKKINHRQRIDVHEDNEKDFFRELEDNDSDESDEYQPGVNKAKEKNYISLDCKIKVINIVKQYP